MVSDGKFTTPVYKLPSIFGIAIMDPAIRVIEAEVKTLSPCSECDRRHVKMRIRVSDIVEVNTSCTNCSRTSSYAVSATKYNSVTDASNAIYDAAATRWNNEQVVHPTASLMREKASSNSTNKLIISGVDAWITAHLMPQIKKAAGGGMLEHRIGCSIFYEGIEGAHKHVAFQRLTGVLEEGGFQVEEVDISIIIRW